MVALRVPAGLPGPAQDEIVGRIDLNHDLVKHPLATYYVRVEGDSMEPCIHAGELLVSDRMVETKAGDVVVARVGEEFTVKRLHIEEGGRISLAIIYCAGTLLPHRAECLRRRLSARNFIDRLRRQAYSYTHVTCATTLPPPFINPLNGARQCVFLERGRFMQGHEARVKTGARPPRKRCGDNHQADWRLPIRE